jgi:hypothetical protein
MKEKGEICRDGESDEQVLEKEKGWRQTAAEAAEEEERWVDTCTHVQKYVSSMK